MYEHMSEFTQYTSVLKARSTIDAVRRSMPNTCIIVMSPMISGTLGAQSAEYKGPASVHRYPHGSHKCQRDGESAAVEISVYKLFRAVFVTC
jgi:hypothetical protein